MGIRQSVSGNMVFTPGGSIGTCPFIIQYVNGNCGCFTNGEPDNWSSGTSYAHLDCVAYNSKLWYSNLLTANTGNTPGSSPYWTEYYSCGNEDWNTYSPFGGIGTTPERFGISIHFTTDAAKHYVNIQEGGNCARMEFMSQHCEVHAYIECVATGTLNPGALCAWDGFSGHIPVDYAVEWDFGGGDEGTNSGTGSYSPPNSLNAFLRIVCLGLSRHATMFPLNSWTVEENAPQRAIDIHESLIDSLISEAEGIQSGGVSETPDICEIIGTKSSTNHFDQYAGSPCQELIEATYDRSSTISWRPLDCAYERWDAAKSYTYDDCVAWRGKFYGCCIANTGNAPEEDASNICEVGYYWRLA